MMINMDSAIPDIMDRVNEKSFYLDNQKIEIYKIRDLFKVKLYTIRSETKKRERDFKYLLTLILTGES